MAFTDELERQGNWLFRWRSYLPMVFIPIAVIAVRETKFPWDSARLHDLWEWVCLLISLLGIVIRALVIGYAPAGTSGRNTKSQIAASLNTSGMYSIVRHPLYLGNFLIGLGITLIPWVWWLPLLYALSFFLYYERIMLAEEEFLQARFGSAFRAWALTTPAFFPRLSGWRPPSLPFSFRNVLRREYTGLLVIVVGHAGMEFAEYELLDNYDGQLLWAMLTAGTLLVYLGLRMLKRHTELLDVPGR